MKKTKIIASLILGLIFFSFVFAQAWQVYFASRTMVRFPQSGRTFYVESESRANQVQVGTRVVAGEPREVFETFGIPDQNEFILRSNGNVILSLRPQGGTVDFGFLGNDFDQYLRRWQEVSETTVRTAHILGGLVPNGFYRVEVNNTPILIGQANSNGEITFDHTGAGAPSPQTFSLNACNYKPQGSFTSKNLLYGKDAREILRFLYRASIPAGTSIEVQFSRDGTSWFNSQGEADVWESLSDGTHEINFTNWKGTNLSFYYRARLRSEDCSQTPILGEIGVRFITIK